MTGWDALDRLLDEAPGDYSVCVQAPGGRSLYTWAPDVVRSAASLIKVALAMALVESDSARRRGGKGIDLRATVTLRESDRARGEGALEGSFDVAPAGTTRTLWELIGHALRESDNTASNLLIDAIGMEAVDRFVRAAPFYLEQTRLQRRFMDLAAAAAGRDNLTTAREMCILFSVLLAGDECYAPLVEWLKNCSTRDKLVAGLPQGIVAAHKVGNLPGVEHDAGIVYAPGGPYIVALLSVSLPDPHTGKATIAEGSRLIYHEMAT